MKINECVLKTLRNDAMKAFKRNEIPVSAVVVDASGNVISHAFNSRQKSCDVLGHAEVLAIRKAERKIKDWRLNGYSMYVSLEPCNMCSMFIKECRLDHVFYFLSKKTNDLDVISISKSEILEYEEEKKYYNDLLTLFFSNKR